MKSIKFTASCFCLAAFTLSVFTTGCGVARRIAWSPDGLHAAVIAGDGLRLCTADGALSGALAPEAHEAEWFPDSRRLAVLSVSENKSWSVLAKVIPTAERERVEQAGRTVLDQLNAGHNLDTLNPMDDLGDGGKAAVKAYLAQIPGTDQVAGANWKDLKGAEADLCQIRIGALSNGTLALAAPLFSTAEKIFGLRVSPAGTAIAFTIEGGLGPELWVMPADGLAPPQLVAKSTAYGSDWSADGHSLVYIHALHVTATPDDENYLASLTRREVLNNDGKVEIQNGADDLATLVYTPCDEVRCLGDGRILFAAADIHFPSTKQDMPEQLQLYSLDPAKQPSVIPVIPRKSQGLLPAGSNFYEPSSDGKLIAISTDKGAVVVLTLATGDIVSVQAAGEDETACAPAWRTADELCFISSPAKDQLRQVTLRKNGANRILSAAWPAEARKGFLDK